MFEVVANMLTCETLLGGCCPGPPAARQCMELFAFEMYFPSVIVNEHVMIRRAFLSGRIALALEIGSSLV